MYVKFSALEYTQEDTFENSEYEFLGSENTGWTIFRNGKEILHLSKGYKLLKTKLCGVCSTDLDRRFLPFALPQIIGHEVLAEDESGQAYVVEINDTYQARGEEEDIFCKLGLSTHSPDRLVLGIDRLPGGFGKYILAPKNAILPIGKISSKTAVLTEPFAAALQAVLSSPPKENSSVAVLGPRRLGNLLIAALAGYRTQSKKNFTITAIARRENILQISKQLGADKTINISTTSPRELLKSFDIVYDTTASPEGFELALELSKKEVHLKSTNGQEVCGVKKMTDLVVDELSILPYSEENLNFHWEIDNWKNETIWVSPTLQNKLFSVNNKKFYFTKLEQVKNLWSKEFIDKLPRFDLAIVTNLEEIDLVIRPFVDSQESLVRPKGAILVYPNTEENKLLKFINEGGQIRSSRCGNFQIALQILENNPELSSKLESTMITHELQIHELAKAFELARDSSSIKVIVRHT